MSFDLTTIQPDFAIAAAYKWLLGPYSTGIMYVHPKHHLGHPLELNAFARKDAVDFQNLVAYRDEYQPAARRFDMGEMGNFALLPALLTSLNQLIAWELPRVENTLREINKVICDHGRRTGFDILPEPFRSPHFTGLRFKNDIPSGLIQNLAEQNIFVSARGQSLRVTPHLYNDLDDVDRFFTALSRLL
jgi:selenocysteine lyase/cysteine desulfurase